MSRSHRNALFVILGLFVLAWGPGLQFLGSVSPPPPVSSAGLTEHGVPVTGRAQPLENDSAGLSASAARAAAGGSAQLRGSEQLLEPRYRPSTGPGTPKAAVVYFGFDCDIVSKAAARALEGYFSDVPSGSVFAIDGHTDSIDTDQHNLDLSKRRAQAVAAALSNPAWTIEVNWFGESRPLAQDTKADGTDNPKGRMLNRRVEIRTMPDKKPQDPPTPATFGAGPCPVDTHGGQCSVRR